MRSSAGSQTCVHRRASELDLDGVSAQGEKFTGRREGAAHEQREGQLPLAPVLLIVGQRNVQIDVHPAPPLRGVRIGMIALAPLLVWSLAVLLLRLRRLPSRQPSDASHVG